MSISLHTATVGAFLQVLPPVSGLVSKAVAHCAEKGLPDSALSEAALAPDMWPFAKQVAMAIAHSAGAIRGVRAGVFSPDFTPPPADFASMKASVDDAVAFLEGVSVEEVEGMIGGDMRFEIGERKMPFTAEDYLLTFALPNFYFHATAAYTVLRNQGVAVGKMDFLGKLRMKG